MNFSKKLVDNLSKSSMIRAWFEEGVRLRKQYGAENVYDYSLGNPEVEPPVEIQESLVRLVNDKTPGMHRYMLNAGYQEVREKVAAWTSARSGVPLMANHIVMVVGAAAGLNIVLRALLNPGEEVICLKPFFGEYTAYIDHAGGRQVLVSTDCDTFQPDPDAIAAAIGPNTKAILLNSPNNPTGAVYKREILNAVAARIAEKEAEYGTQIFVISDEPYVSITYDNVEVPNLLGLFRNAIVVNSFSKSLALPGERIGYIAASSRIADVSVLMDVMVVLNRTLGFVNAPALFQRLIADNLDVKVDTEIYRKRRDLLYNHLVSLGFECFKPEGAFYLFVKTLDPDDMAFAKAAVRHNLLIVPGSGFGWPGWMRLAYCVDIGMIERSLPAFTALAQEYAAAK